jgi:hypothetical protein
MKRLKRLLLKIHRHLLFLEDQRIKAMVNSGRAFP